MQAASLPVHDGANDLLLIVDDDRTFCSALAAALRPRDLRPIVAHTLPEAVAEANTWQPARALVDLRIGEASGLHLIAELRRIRPTMRIVVFTGFGSIPTAVEAIKLGAVHYLAKPAELDEILSAFDRTEPTLLSPLPPTPPRTLEVVEWEHLQQVLIDCQGNVSEAARRLQMHRRSLQRKLARGGPSQALLSATESAMSRVEDRDPATLK
jgi:two-component system response regulator RegA